MTTNLLYIEDQLARLRKEWVARPDKRSIILLQAKALIRARELIEQKSAEPDTYEQARQIFGDPPGPSER